MPEERIVYKVTFPIEDDSPVGRSVSLEVSVHPLTGRRTVLHQVWLLLSRKGYEIDPTKGEIRAVGTEELKTEEGK
ncbi:hypothetical protein ABT160_04500 [Streptomyces sp. NPDC001941]|uniref:hypothetical protein n=1 Tax=Streptomyces sp. NPDC001941 TaxID=3154659 RepID=UPI003319FD10